MRGIEVSVVGLDRRLLSVMTTWFIRERGVAVVRLTMKINRR